MSENGKTKRYEELSFTDDFMFCKILQNDPDLCRELTELILSRKIGRIVSIDRQKAIEITADGKGVRFDVYMEDDESTVYDIEMQTTVAEDLPKRMRYYQGMIDLNMIERGARYKELKKSFIIFICLKNPYPEAGLHKYSIRSVCEEDVAIDFDDGIFKVILSARGDKGDVSDEMSKFLLYLTDQRTESDLTKRLNERVLAARSHEKWRREYMTLQERDELMREEGRKEGWEEGRKEGREEGRKEGREEGRKEGREEGREEGTETANLSNLKNLMEALKISAESAIDLVKIPAEEREKYLAKL